MRLTRADLLKKATNRPLHQIGWGDLRGPMKVFDTADVVIITDGAKANIKKDRQGQYLHLERDENGLVDASKV